ncbi:hypothetical protein PpBr36_01875 [Pyricularia pennisetigena]|uniref:hypothetical protein n=1 Tax=Pyricularia pennisetigena TaxID=1578925 RepID=UPI001153F354|nr:hypothetical protein PpBr36_01875 [Pyricularia pennisetigena]TLS29743.1 hypothetical protein PpBr36_01875 [Pyricularia pennisetigena]
MGSSKQIPQEDDSVQMEIQPTAGVGGSESSNSGADGVKSETKAAGAGVPPSYDSVPEPQQQAVAQPHPQGQGISDAEIIQPFAVSSKDGAESFMDMRLDRDPDFLEANIKIWAQKPPSFYMQVHGTHRERRTRRTNGRTETYTVTVTDFNVGVPLHGFLFGQPRPGQTSPPQSFSWIRTVENHEKVPRGTVRARQGPMPAKVEGVEEPPSEAMPKPTLQEWCHRYCASFAGRKTFVVERRVGGLDVARLEANAMAIVRSTGYSGDVSITFDSFGTEVEVLSSNKINQWRRFTWLRIVCYVTFLWIFTWPFLYFFTKKFHCVYVEWPFSRIRSDGLKEYVSLTEDQMLEVWGRAMFNAVTARSTDVLNQQDLMTAQAAGGVGYGMGGFGNSINQQYGWGRDGWGGSSL